MGLSLREVLELQRRQREEKDATSAPRPAPSPPTSTAMPLQPSPPPAPAPKPVEQATGRGLLSRLQTQGANNAPTSSVQMGTGTANRGNGSAAPTIGGSGVNAQTVGQAPVQQIAEPIFTQDETEILKKNLAFLATNMDEKDAIGQILRSTVKQLQEHPELSSVMIDTDYDLIVAAARRSMKYAMRKKEDKADKADKKKQGKDELDAWLKDQGIEL